MLLMTLSSLLLAVGAAAIPHDKRNTLSDVTIYAYGTGISGLPVLADSSGTNSFLLSPLPIPPRLTGEHNG
jgi:hypothetical protein